MVFSAFSSCSVSIWMLVAPFSIKIRLSLSDCIKHSILLVVSSNTVIRYNVRYFSYLLSFMMFMLLAYCLARFILTIWCCCCRQPYDYLSYYLSAVSCSIFLLSSLIFSSRYTSCSIAWSYLLTLTGFFLFSLFHTADMSLAVMSVCSCPNCKYSLLNDLMAAGRLWSFSSRDFSTLNSLLR